MTPPVQLTASLHPKPWLVGSDESFPFGIPVYFQEVFAVSFWGSVLYQKRKCYKKSISELRKKKTPANVSFRCLPLGVRTSFSQKSRWKASCKQSHKPNCRTVALLQCGSIYSSVGPSPKEVHDANMSMKWSTIFCLTPLHGREWRVLWPFSSKAQQAQICEEKYWWKNSNDHHLLWIIHTISRAFF